MCDWPYLFCKLGMSAATSGNEWMYDDPCNAKGAGCSERGVVRNYGREAQKTRGRRKEKAGSKTSTSGMVGARQRWSEERRLGWNILCSGCIDSTYRGTGTHSMASAYGGIEQWTWVSRCGPGLRMARATIWILSNVILIPFLVSNSSVSPCSVCVPQYPEREVVLHWTMFTQAIARLGSRVGCAAGSEHFQSISTTKNCLRTPLGLPNVMVLLLESRFPCTGRF